MRNRNQLMQGLGQRGFSIVEAMVALLVLSVGMLGIAGLYVTTLRASGSALYRTHAVNFAADMADRIRANPTAGVEYENDPAGAAQCVDSGITCTPAQLAADDLLTWQQQMAALLPDDGDANTLPGTVDFTAGNPNAYEIRVRWSEPTEPVQLDYVLRMQI